MLQESKILYDVLDNDSDFDNYRLIVLPDGVPVSGTLESRLRAYLAAGGKILATGVSALDEDTGEFSLPLGARSRGETKFSPAYLVPNFALNNWDQAAFVVYSRLQDIETEPGASVLAERQDLFFNRDFLHFSSHQHAPSTQVNCGAVIAATANTVYVAFPAFTQYAEMGQAPLREILAHCIRTLLPHATLATSLPAQGIQTVQYQSEQDRFVIHLLYASPVKRGAGIEVIEDIVPLYNVDVALRTKKAPTRVTLEPQGQSIAFVYEGDTVKTIVSKLDCHQMVVIK